jgi:16S rRNA (guanine527-N7)-methyltransferase
VTQDEIAELLRPLLGDSFISPQQLQQVSDYLDLLLKWNARINLTAVRRPAEILQRHFGESFFSARHLLAAEASETSAIDIGSGAGFPGLPLKIWAPRLNLTLIESNQKKVAFLREAARLLKLDDVKVLPVRAENVNAAADLVTLRAVERFENILPTALRLVSPGGTLALLIGEAQEKLALKVVADVNWGSPIAIPGSRSRVLLVGRLTPAK